MCQETAVKEHILAVTAANTYTHIKLEIYVCILPKLCEYVLIFVSLNVFEQYCFI